MPLAVIYDLLVVSTNIILMFEVSCYRHQLSSNGTKSAVRDENTNSLPSCNTSTRYNFDISILYCWSHDNWKNHWNPSTFPTVPFSSLCFKSHSKLRTSLQFYKCVMLCYLQDAAHIISTKRFFLFRFVQLAIRCNTVFGV